MKANLQCDVPFHERKVTPFYSYRGNIVMSMWIFVRNPLYCFLYRFNIEERLSHPRIVYLELFRLEWVKPGLPDCELHLADYLVSC